MVLHLSSHRSERSQLSETPRRWFVRSCASYIVGMEAECGERNMGDTAGNSTSKRFKAIAPKPAAWMLPSTLQGFASMGQGNSQLLTQLCRTALGLGEQGPQGGKRTKQSKEERARQRLDKRNTRQRIRRLEAKQKEEAEQLRLSRARIKAVILGAQGGTHLADETLSFLLHMWDEGELKDGTDDLGGGLQGCNNGMFYGVLSMSKAPPPRYRTAGHGNVAFWSAGEARKHYSREAFKACMAAGFPLILEGDSPSQSLMGAVGQQALDAGITRLGNLGGRYGTSMFNLDKSFVRQWVAGLVGPELLPSSFGRDSTWTIQNFEEDIRVDAKSLATMRCDEAKNLLRETRMGGLCYPWRGCERGGELVHGFSVNDEYWAGSECTSFAMVAGSVTSAHVDSQLVQGKEIFLPAAGIMQCANRRENGPAKRAVVICAHDMSRVVDVLRLNTSHPSAAQHRGPELDVDGLASKLKENSIKFVVCDFPPDCSYAIPSRCAHMFVTLRLVESCVWHPAL